MYIIYCKCLIKRSAIIDFKTKEVIDDGSNKDMIIGSFSDKTMADFFYNSVINRVEKDKWKVWRKTI